MNPYYQDDFVTLYHADYTQNHHVVDEVDALVTDPPYFKVKDEEWDNQWEKADDFLNWTGEWLDLTKPKLTASASIWIFASPALTSSIERLVGQRFKVLNSIRWVKEAGWHQKAELAAQRRFTTPWEGLIFAEQHADQYEDAAKALHKEVFSPIGRYLQSEWERAGWKSGALGKAIGRDSALPTRWAEGSSLPNPDDYQKVRELLNNGKTEYEYLRREYEDLRRPFSLTDTAYRSDIWNFNPVPGYPGKHPCEKPIAMMEHIVKTSTRAGGSILDPFAGSGSTLRAAKNLGRKAIGFEIEEKYCEITAQRLAQETLGIF